MASINFSFEGVTYKVQCSKEEKMENICKKFAIKIEKDINILYFIYNGSIINLSLNLTFEQQANSMDKERNIMDILVDKTEENGLSCPKCGERIYLELSLEKELIDNLVSPITKIKDILVGLKIQIDGIINNKSIENNVNYINSQLKNINIIINNAISETKAIEKQINKFENLSQNDIQFKILKMNENNINIIEGILDINLEEINNGITLFNREKKDGLDVYLNDVKINLIKEKNKWKIMQGFKKGENKFKIIFNDKLTSLYRFFEDCSTLKSVDLTNLNTSNVNELGWMFNGCKKLKKIKGLNGLSTSNVINMRGFFQQCGELESIDLSNIDTSNVIDISYMFNKCSKLKIINGMNCFNTKNVLFMDKMFQACNKLECIDLLNFDTSKVCNIEGLFYGCSSLKEIKGLNKLNTSYALKMKNMFAECESLELIDVTNFDTSNIWEIERMFFGCKKLKEIKGLNKLNTSKVINMKGLFQECGELESLDLSTFNTSNVIDMSYMFSFCVKLKEIKGIEKFDTIKVTNMESMFKCCKELKSLDLKKFNTSEVLNMELMFGGCHSLKEIKGINNFKTNNVTNLRQMFQECNLLESLDLSNFDTSKVTDMIAMFYKCKSLKNLNLLKFSLPPESTSEMFSFIDKKECNLITNNKNLDNLFKNSYN